MCSRMLYCSATNIVGDTVLVLRKCGYGSNRLSWLLLLPLIVEVTLEMNAQVTSAGGGSAIPLHPRLLARLVSAAVDGAKGVPVTVKMRIGVSEELHTFIEAGRVSEAEGAAGVTLHARTARAGAGV